MTTLNLLRFTSTDELNRALVERLERAISDPGSAHSAVMLSGGHTPLTAYRELGLRRPRPAAGLHLLYSDDRYVPAYSEASNYFQTRALLDPLGLPEEQLLRVRTELPLEEAASDYARRIAAMLRSGARISLGLLGLGADGHTASLFNPTQLIAARDHLAIAVQRPDGMQGVSVTPAVLTQVGQLIFLVTGADKRDILQAFLREDSDLTARRAIADRSSADVWVAP